MRPRGRPVSSPTLYGWEPEAERVFALGVERFGKAPAITHVVMGLVTLGHGESATYKRVRRHLRRAGLPAPRKGGV